MADTFAELVDALRAVQDSIRLAALSPVEAEQAAELLRQVNRLATKYPAAPGAALTSQRLDLPGRGNALIPGFTMTEQLPRLSRGTGTFSPAHLGRGAVHGGSISLLFDEVLGRLVERDGPSARTAYLLVNYRALTPVDTELSLEARIDGREGRKIFASATLRERDRVLADATGLWVAPR
jgi:acyl-coenzyme A thioesterase PaaI-like protein